MKIKRVNASIMVLAGLVMLSWAFFVVAQESATNTGNIFLDSDQDGLSDSEEKLYGTDPHNADTDGDGYSDGTEIKAGYDPTIPAPNDRIGEVKSTTSSSATDNSPTTPQTDTQNNLTTEVAQKLSEITTASTDNPDQQVSLDQIQSLIDNALNTQQSEADLPTISESDIKIKKQNYSNLSTEKAKERRKEDFLSYIISVYYILSSNSPTPVTSVNDINTISSSLCDQLISAITSKNSKTLSELANSGQKIMDQMKEVEVPEDLVDMHIKALRFAQYSITLKDTLKTDSSDPLGEIANLSKIKGLIGSLSSFSTDVAARFSEYDITYDSTLQERLKKAGLLAPDPNTVVQSLSSLAGDATSTTATTTTSTDLNGN